MGSCCNKTSFQDLIRRIKIFERSFFVSRLRIGARQRKRRDLPVHAL